MRQPCLFTCSRRRKYGARSGRRTTLHAKGDRRAKARTPSGADELRCLEAGPRCEDRMLYRGARWAVKPERGGQLCTGGDGKWPRVKLGLIAPEEGGATHHGVCELVSKVRLPTRRARPSRGLAGAEIVLRRR
eukprot:1641502-Pleurochrysis_carterae.AAC.1